MTLLYEKMNKIVLEVEVPSYSKLLKFYINGVRKKKVDGEYQNWKM